QRYVANFIREILQWPELGDIEHGHEPAVIVPAGRLDAKAQTRQQSAQHLHDRGETASFIALGPAKGQQRAAFAKILGVRGVTAGSIDDPAFWNLFVARDSKRNLSSRHRRGRHIETKGTLEIRWYGDRNWIGAETRL